MENSVITGSNKSKINLNVSDINNVNKIRNINCSKNMMPEIQENKYIVDMSPKINSFFIDKMKLNLDIPEEDDTNNNIIVRNFTPEQNTSDINSFEKTLSVGSVYKSDIEETSIPTIKVQDFSKSYSFNVKNDSTLLEVPRKELTSLSGYFEIPSSSFNIKSSVTHENNYGDKHLKWCQTNLFEKSFLSEQDELLHSTQIVSFAQMNESDSQTSLKNRTVVKLPEVSNLMNDEAQIVSIIIL